MQGTYDTVRLFEDEILFIKSTRLKIIGTMSKDVRHVEKKDHQDKKLANATYTEPLIKNDDQLQKIS